MSVSLESIATRSLNPSSSFSAKRASSSMALCYSPGSLDFQPARRHRRFRACFAPSSIPPSEIGLRLPPIHRPSRRNLSLVSLAAPQEESRPSDLEFDQEVSDLRVGMEESEEAWKQTLASFREQALKMQNLSKDAYELYSKKAMVILIETSEKLKVQAEKARWELSVLAKEIDQESKEYLSKAAESSPQEVKDILETFASSSDEIKDVSKVQDFYIGVPYGAFLSVTGFMLFMLTGSISAIRFGVILGGSLLALSVYSLRSWKSGQPSSLALKGQAAIATILFLRDLRLVFVGPFIATFIRAFISGLVVAFYAYRILNDGEQKNGATLEARPEN